MAASAKTKVLARVRAICLAMPESSERLSHGAPTFFVKKKVFTMFVDGHHPEGLLSLWIPMPDGAQASLIDSDPKKFFRPPYVGVSGWIGVVLKRVGQKELRSLIGMGWEKAAPPSVKKAVRASGSV